MTDVEIDRLVNSAVGHTDIAAITEIKNRLRASSWSPHAWRPVTSESPVPGQVVLGINIKDWDPDDSPLFSYVVVERDPDGGFSDYAH